MQVQGGGQAAEGELYPGLKRKDYYTVRNPANAVP